MDKSSHPPKVPAERTSAERNKEPSVQPTSNEQSGSTGRSTPPGSLGRDKDSGQDRYGQSGYGGKNEKRLSSPDGEGGSKTESNEGSGLVEHEKVEYQGNSGADDTSVNSRPRQIGKK